MMRRTLFEPRVTIFTKDGRSFTREGTGRKFVWGLREASQAHRVHRSRSRYPGTQFATLIDTCRNLDRIESTAHQLIAPTISPA